MSWPNQQAPGAERLVKSPGCTLPVAAPMEPACRAGTRADIHRDDLLGPRLFRRADLIGNVIDAAAEDVQPAIEIEPAFRLARRESAAGG